MSIQNGHTKSIQIFVHPMTIVVSEEQEDVYKKVKDAMERAIQIMNDETLDVEHRLKAMQIVGYLGQVLSGVLKVVKFDEIQEQLLELEEKIKRMGADGRRRRGAPIYTSE